MKQIDEVTRRGYKRWGILTHEGKLIEGENHPTAQTHSDLWKNTPAKNRNSVVEYAHSEDGSDMMIRTCSKHGIITALKHWSKLPTGPTTVTHDHCDNGEGATHYGNEERPHHVMLKMNKMLKEYD